MLVHLVSTRDPMEAPLVLARLRDAGIPCMRGVAGHERVVVGRGSDLYVNAEDLDRAREVLAEDRAGFDEDELARLSEEAGREWAGGPAPVSASAPAPTSPPADVDPRAAPVAAESAQTVKGRRLASVVRRLANRDTGTPGDPFGR